MKTYQYSMLLDILIKSYEMNLERVKQFYSWEKKNNEKSGLKKQEKRREERGGGK